MLYRKIIFSMLAFTGLLFNISVESMALGSWIKQTWQTPQGKLGIVAGGCAGLIASIYVGLRVKDAWRKYTWHQQNKELENNRNNALVLVEQASKDISKIVREDDAQKITQLMKCFNKACPWHVQASETEAGIAIERFLESTLYAAVDQGSVHTVSVLLGLSNNKNDDNVDYYSNHLCTLLHNQTMRSKALSIANKNGHIDIVKQLLDPRIPSFDFAPDKYLEESIGKDKPTMVIFWIDWMRKRDYSFVRDKLARYIDLACKHGSFASVRELCNVPGSLLSQQDLCSAQRFSECLAIAAENNHFRLVQFFKEKIDEAIRSMRTKDYLACINHEPLDHDYHDYDDYDRYKVPVAKKAIEKGHDAIALYLIDDAMIQLDQINYEACMLGSLVHCAVQFERWNIVSKLIEQDRSEQLLYYKVLGKEFNKRPSIYILNIIVEACSKQESGKKWKVFFQTASNRWDYAKSVSFLNLLATINIHINYKIHYGGYRSVGDILIYLCRESDRPTLTKYLLEQGWDPATSGDDVGLNPLHYAVNCNHHVDKKLTAQLLQHNNMVRQALKKAQEDPTHCFSSMAADPLVTISNYCSLSPASLQLPDEVKNALAEIGESLSGEKRAQLESIVERYLWNGGSFGALRLAATNTFASNFIDGLLGCARLKKLAQLHRDQGYATDGSHEKVKDFLGKKAEEQLAVSIAQGAKEKVERKKQSMELFAAIKADDVKMTAEKTTYYTLNARDENNNTPLHAAVIKNNLSIVKELLAKKCSVQHTEHHSDTVQIDLLAKNYDGNTALKLALIHGYDEIAIAIVTKLIEQKNQADIRDEIVEKYAFAARYSRQQFVDFIEKNGVLKDNK